VLWGGIFLEPTWFIGDVGNGWGDRGLKERERKQAGTQVK